MDRRIFVTLALAASLALAAGCGEKSEPPTTGAVVAQTTTGAQTATGAQTTTGATTTPSATPTPGSLTPNDRAAIVSTIDDFLTSAKAPDVCDELLTQAFVRQAYGDRQGCLAGRRPASLASRAEVSGVRIAGARARASARAAGGLYAGEMLEVVLVRSGSSWQLDALRSNAKVGP